MMYIMYRCTRSPYLISTRTTHNVACYGSMVHFGCACQSVMCTSRQLTLYAPVHALRAVYVLTCTLASLECTSGLKRTHGTRTLASSAARCAHSCCAALAAAAARAMVMASCGRCTRHGINPIFWRQPSRSKSPPIYSCT